MVHGGCGRGVVPRTSELSAFYNIVTVVLAQS